MSRKAKRWLLIGLAIAAVLIVMPVYFVADSLVCGPVSTALLPRKTGGPHYYESFNHMCTPWHPVGEAPAGAWPDNTDTLIEAWFDDKGRVVLLDKFFERGKLFWRVQVTYDARGYVKTQYSGQVGDQWKLREYDGRTLLKETPAPPPPAEALRWTARTKK